MELNLKPMSKLEQQYSYSHDEAVDAATRCLGHLRGDMGSTGKAFYFTWFDHCGELKTPAFKSEFDDVINELRANEATFEDALAEIEKYYGLTTTEGQDLTLTEAEIESLKAAFELSMLPAEERVLGDEEALLYGGYEPLSMAVCHIINNKAGLSFTSYAHTGLQIPVYAMGVGAENFAGLYDNTDIFTKTMAAMGLQADA